jgi:hypothetical protein
MRGVVGGGFGEDAVDGETGGIGREKLRDGFV